MSEKYLIFGATGSIGSSLAEQLKKSGRDIHLIARNENEVSSIAKKLGCTYTVADVLENGFIEKVKKDINDIKGIAYCVGSIDLKPLRMVSEQDFNKCMKLNLYSAVEAIKGFQESLKKIVDADAKSLLAVHPVHEITGLVDDAGYFRAYVPGQPRRRQERVQSFGEASTIYVCRVDYLRLTGSLVADDWLAIEVPAEQAVDINAPHDFEFCEFLMQRRAQQK